MGEMFPFVYDEASIHKIRLATFIVGEKGTFIAGKNEELFFHLNLWFRTAQHSFHVIKRTST